jgi:hypothetical protein
MALNPEQISFFLRRIEEGSLRTFGSEVTQLFNYLAEEIKDNPVYLSFEKESVKWKTWIKKSYSIGTGEYQLPTNYSDAKHLAYTAFKIISESDGEGSYVPARIIGTGNYEEGISLFKSLFYPHFTKVLEDIITANPELEGDDYHHVSGDTVFVIHGHDDYLKTEVQLLLNKAGVRNIVLHEVADKGRTLIEKLIEEGKNSNYAIALLSPDDLLNDGNKRARQNVILEVGFFMGFLGKERMRMLIKENVEIPSDLNGILYEKYDNAGAWKLKILKELQATGIFIDFNAVIEKF